MHRVVRRVAVLVLGALVAVPTTGALAAPPPVQTVDVSQRVGNESEESIAVREHGGEQSTKSLPELLALLREVTSVS